MVGPGDSGGASPRLLAHLFDEAASHYDQIINLMSLGSGAWYRRDALRRAGLTRGMTVLDVAVGTGAVARAAASIVGPAGRVVGLDPSTGMLREAKKRVPIPLTQAVAEWLPFRDGVFDFLSMGYAIRHVSDLSHTFGEYFRVLRGGGTLLILDFARPRSRVGHGLGRFYLDDIVPWMSRVCSGSKEAELLAHYCWDSVEDLVPPATLTSSLIACGFEDARGVARFGLLSEYVGHKPSARST